jgi:hypothetical protein
MKRLLIFFLPVLLIACNNESGTVDNKLFLCQCIENPDFVDTSSTMTKVKYIYLVNGKEGEVDCCSDPLAEKYPAYKETWVNEAPEHPDVWGMKEGPKEELSAQSARKLGCGLEQKEISITSVSSFKEEIKEYYPALAKQK